MLKSRIASGHLVRLNRGVYAVGHRRLNSRGIRIAALFAAGPGAALSHRDAAGLHGLRPANHTCTEITVAKQRAAPQGVRLHRAALPPTDVTRVDGLPVTTVERTLVDLAAVLAADHLAKALHEAERHRLLHLPSIEAVLARTRSRNGRGHAAMRAALADLRAHGVQLTRSELEVDFAALIREHGLPRARLNVTLDGREVDAWWPEAGVAVELDGWRDHGTRRAFQRDREKGNLLSAARRATAALHPSRPRRAAGARGGAGERGAGGSAVEAGARLDAAAEDAGDGVAGVADLEGAAGADVDRVAGAEAVVGAVERDLDVARDHVAEVVGQERGRLVHRGARLVDPDHRHQWPAGVGDEQVGVDVLAVEWTRASSPKRTTSEGGAAGVTSSVSEAR